MTVLPAIVRELRTQARLASTYALRVLGAAVLLGATVFFAVNSGFSPDEGGDLFGGLNCSLFFAIWLIVPLLAADCISSERREGTLGLLFMTPLKARDIVLAKSFVHGLRALSLLLAVIPVITIPFLLGGVSWREAVWSATINFCSLTGALAAGLLASAVSKRWLRAQIFACLLGAGFAMGFVCLAGIYGSIYGWSIGPGARGPGYPFQDNVDWIMQIGFVATTDFNGGWGTMWASGGTGRSSIAVAGITLVVFAGCFLLIAIEVAAWRLRRVWQEEPPSARQLWLEKKLVTPIVGVSFLRRWMRRKLQRNPIGWLEQRTWSGRLVTWSWFAVMVSLYSAGLGGQYAYRALNGLQNLMGWLLLLGMASSAAGSFQRERETGVMELLLVSPMTERQIIGGRVRGLLGQFLPAAALFLGVWFYFKGIMPEWSSRVDMQFLCVSCLVLPVIGLYYSLRRKNFITAFLSTIFMGLLLPLIVAGILTFLVRIFFTGDANSGQNPFGGDPGGFYPGGQSSMFRGFVSSPLFLTFLQLAMAARCDWRLYHDLKRRNFAFSRTVT